VRITDQEFPLRRILVITPLAMVALALLAVVYIRQNVRVAAVHRERGEDVSIELPGGRVNIRARRNLDPESMGVPIYPGARRGKDGGGATFEWSPDDGKADRMFGVSGAEYVTPDSETAVREWYQGQLPGWTLIRNGDGRRARFEIIRGSYKRFISIQPKSDGTHIGVASVGEPASN
jgi:hypothetical protein